MKKAAHNFSIVLTFLIVSGIPAMGYTNIYSFDDRSGSGGAGGITQLLEQELNTWPNMVKCHSTYQSASNHNLYTMSTTVFVLSQARITIDKVSGTTNDSIVIYQQAGPLSTTATMVFNARTRTILFDASGSNMPRPNNCTQGTHINALNTSKL